MISLGAFCDAMMETLQWKIALALYWKKIFGDSNTSLIVMVVLKRREEKDIKRRVSISETEI